MMRIARWGVPIIAAGTALVLAGCSGGGGGGDDDAGLTILFGSSGDAETQALQSAVDAWSAESGTSVELVAASDLTQQLGQGFSGGNPPDLFYMSWDQFQTYAANRYLDAYAADLPDAAAFYPALQDAFTYDDTFTCAPKDFSTLGLVINTQLWEAAGLTDADVPTDWAGLQRVAEALTTDGTVGLSMAAEHARVGVFMNQAGGQLVDDDGTTVTADSPENLAGLEYVQGLLASGTAAFPADLDAGWAGEAFGNGTAAMAIEGPWINGAMAADFPDVQYRVVELPAGETSSTFTFSNCWGIPAGSDTRDQAVDLVEYLTSDEQQLAFAEAFGVIPSTESGAAEYATRFPENEPFVAGNDYAVSPVAFDGAAAVITDFNSSLGGLATGDAEAILTQLQTDLQAALDEANGS